MGVVSYGKASNLLAWPPQLPELHIIATFRIKSSEIIVLDDVHGFLVFQVSAELPCDFKIVILTEP